MSRKLKTNDRSTANGKIGRARRAGGRSLVDDLACPILEVTPLGRLRFANHAATTLLGLEPHDLDKSILDRLAFSPDEQLRIVRRAALLLAQRVPAILVRLERRRSVERSTIWRVSARHDTRGRLLGFTAIAETVPVRHGYERRAAASEARAALIRVTTPDWFWETDTEHRFCYLGEPLEAITGIGRAALLGRTRTELMAATMSADALARHEADLAARRPFHDLCYGLVVNGERRLVCSSGRPVFDGQGQFLGYRGTAWEIGGAEHASERLRYLARYDPLTGLVNRQALGDLLGAALAEARQTGGNTMLLVIDLAGFKRVNDSYGHGIGDQLLQQVAARLRRSVGRSDIVARLSGDEFAAVVPLPEPNAASAVGIAERIADRLRQPYGIEGHEIYCGVWIGITLSPLHGDAVPALLQQAELALHEAKRHDKGICVFGAELGAATQRRKSIEDALRRALDRDEMSLVLQPQFSVRSRALVGCEALLRWRHGQPDEIGPNAFVPIAEETGLIVAFGSWVLNEACRLAAGWWQGGQGPRIAVNLSPVQFWNRDLCREVADALAAAGLPPRALELEITEGVLMRDTSGAAKTLNMLNELGVAIALDDFGTGYSSLSYLKRFPIHRLKIDQAFIRDLDHDEDDRQIAKAIIGLGHSLNLEVVAEGVETRRQLNFLADLDCDVVQGYFFSMPLAVAAFEAALKGHTWALAGSERPKCGRLLLPESKGRSSIRRFLYQG